VTWDVGGAVSLTALAHVTITGRAYAEIWSDRHCPVRGNTPNGFEGTDPIQVCVDMAEGKLSPQDASRVRELTGNTGNGLFNRENGARFLLSLIGEIAADDNYNIYFILEGAPFMQSERALFTNLFSGSMPDTDYRVYARVGVTYKF